MFASPDYTDRAEARAEKVDGSWGEVAESAELDARTRRAPDRSAQRTRRLARQRARDAVLLERAGPAAHAAAAGHPDDAGAGQAHVSRRMSADELDRRADAAVGSDFTLLDFDCDHMVPLALPAETAAVIREHLG